MSTFYYLNPRARKQTNTFLIHREYCHYAQYSTNFVPLGDFDEDWIALKQAREVNARSHTCRECCNDD